MQQATVNLFADMGAQATTLMSGLHGRLADRPTRRRPTRRSRARRRARRSPTARRVTISGTATDAGGQVAGVEVSTDGGSTWHPATGTTSWSYSWNAHGSPTHDDHVARDRRLAATSSRPSPSVTVNVGCPCTMAGPERDPVDPRRAGPQRGRGRRPLQGRPRRDRSPASASTSRRANTGTHVGNLWTSERDAARHAGPSAARAPSGWQQLTFTTPVDITAGTTYVASYYAPRGPLLGLVGVLLLAEPGRRELARQPAAARDQRQPRRRQRRLLLRGLVDVPDVDLRRRELRGRRRLRAQAPAGSGEQRHGDAGPRLGDRQLHRRPPPAARRRATSSRRSSARRRSPSVTVTGTPPATSVQGRRPRPGDLVHVQGPGRPTAAAPVRSRPRPTRSRRPPRRRRARRPASIASAARPARRPCAGPRRTTAARTITRYTVTPYLGGVAQATTPVTGSPAPTTAVVTGLTNGSAYTFTVTATNSVGDRPRLGAVERRDPERLAAVRPARVRAHRPGRRLQLTPASAITTRQPDRRHGGRVERRRARRSRASPTPPATRTPRSRASRRPTTPSSACGARRSPRAAARKPAITITATGSADIGAAALEYSGLSTARPAPRRSTRFKTATGTSSGSRVRHLRADRRP